ncbi:MAG TPA: slipin family protein [Planktothrix sp.]|jgi:regulator of protease activity HflC (stomatin/prohibitin superfamily)
MLGEIIFGLGAIGGIIALRSLKFVTEYDRLVVFRFGRAQKERGPGMTFVLPLVEKSRKIDTRMITMPIPAQDTMTRDNISVKISAVCFFSTVDTVKSVTKVEDVMTAVNQVAQTTLRSVVGQHELDEILTERDKVNAKLQAMLDRQTENWGIKVNAVEIKDVEIPQQMQRVIAKQAEAERERRAKIVSAEGELQAAEKLAQAAAVISSQPGAMQLRQLQTMVEVSAEKNSTLIFPIPVEIMTGLREAMAGVAEHFKSSSDEE